MAARRRAREHEQIGRLQLERLGVLPPPRSLLPPEPPPPDLAPSAERARQGEVERDERQLADARGLIGRPYRVVDTLALMQRRGSITAAMRAAGERFRDDFAIAHFDPLRATDPTRALLGGDGSPGAWRGPPAGLHVEMAGNRVWRQLHSVGGIAQPAGSCLWHVLGLGRSLKEWAIEYGWGGRPVSREAAGGILVAALGVLVDPAQRPAGPAAAGPANCRKVA